MVVFLGGLVGADLAPAPLWSTLPVSLMVVGVAASSAPAALIMRAIGRPRGFAAGSLLAALAAVAAVAAIGWGSFLLFCAATALIGANGAFVAQYRFAAAESVEESRVGHAVSFVLIGGIAAGFLGPELGRRASGWIALGPFSGSFLSLAGLYLLCAVLVFLLKDPARQQKAAAEEARPLGQILGQPPFRVALLAGVVAYGVMSFAMTATPISMHRIDGFSLSSTARVIQSHVIAMYAPSLLTAFLVGRLGPLRVMGLGVLAMIGSAALALSGHTLPLYGAGLVLLGVGWNFLFIGATTLLTRSYRAAERFKAQALNDFLIFGVQSFASLSAGAVLFLSSWEAVNLAILPVLAATLAALLLYGRASARRARRQRIGPDQ
jgi:predicted MFS family arabinose efflux permease